MKEREKAKKTSFLSHHPEAKGLLLLALAFVLSLALISFEAGAPKANWLGLIGYSIGYATNYLFGLGSFLLTAFLVYLGIKFLGRGQVEHLRTKTVYFTLFLCSVAIMLNLLAENHFPFPSILREKVITETMILELPYPQIHHRYNFGGIPFYYLYLDLPTLSLKQLLSNAGIAITFSIIAFVSMLLFTETRTLVLWQKSKKIAKALSVKIAALKTMKREESEAPLFLNPQQIHRPIFPPPQKMQKRTEKAVEPKEEKNVRPQKIQTSSGSYQIPPHTLLRTANKVDPSLLKKDLRKQSELLEETLRSFGIEAKVGEIQCGPTITAFEVHPSVGVKVQKIKALENDIALNLQAKSIRIIAPIPGKAAVGVEIPSAIPQEVGFKELLMHYQEQNKKVQIPILLGKTVSGEIVMSDLAKMPHCIIAGATGSGKSVCINTIVMSIVMNASPDEIKLLMVDPKKVELTGYTNLPHLIAPVITEAHGAYAALNWLVKEMQLRYEILKQLGLRNISAFNSRKVDKDLESSLSIPIPESMPKIVAIIDEFADLMMASSSDLETPIARIAQMARAVGIHLILATQRPSREVITGLIKANFPTRIAFKVASRINSQIILDETGAESLLGNGDMLFLPPGSSHLIRAQGTYISDEEINKVVQFICDQAPPRYLIPSFDKMPKEELSLFSPTSSSDDSKDSLFEQARSIVLETGTASTTYLQRKLKIGYARAASLMDELEQNGVIGPQEGARPRKVFFPGGRTEEAVAEEE